MVFKKGQKPIGRALKGHETLEVTKRKISEKYKERISKGWISPLKGRPKSEEHKQKMRENHADVSGKNNPMYGKKRNNPKGKDSPSYKTGIKGYRERALKKHGEKCNRCGIEEFKVLLVHHKDRNRENNEMDNLEILCRNCHILEHYEEHKNAVNSKHRRAKKSDERRL